MASTFADIDAYIASFPEDVQAALREIRGAVKEIIPQATEAIKYDMPTFVLHGNLVHFAAFKKHIGFYGAPTGVAAFAEDFAGCKTGRGSVQFPLSEPMPLGLVRKIVHYRVQQLPADKNP